MNTRRKITAFLFILSLLIPFTTQIVLQVKLAAIRGHMNRKLEKEQLTAITIPVQDMRWAEHEKELHIGNRLLDIKTMHISNGYAFITGLFDDAEQLAQEQLAGNNESQPLNSLLEDLLSGSYHHSFSEQPPVPAFPDLHVTNGITAIKKHSPPFTAVAAPPPWRV